MFFQKLNYLLLVVWQHFWQMVIVGVGSGCLIDSRTQRAFNRCLEEGTPGVRGASRRCQDSPRSVMYWLARSPRGPDFFLLNGVHFQQGVEGGKSFKKCLLSIYPVLKQWFFTGLNALHAWKLLKTAKGFYIYGIISMDIFHIRN